MNNKIIYLLLALVLVLLINNTLQDCSNQERTEAEYKKQIERSQKLSENLEKLASRRIDSTHTIERIKTELIIEKEREQNEILNLTNIDSVIKRYYYWRPDSVSSTDR